MNNIKGENCDFGIFNPHLYIAKKTKGTSGFQQWGKYDTYLIRSEKAKTGKGFYDVIIPYCPIDYRDTRFEICDGHLPGYRPVVDNLTAGEYVMYTPGGMAQVLDS